MTTPLQDVELNGRRIGKLHNEDFVSRNRARQRMEAVEDQSDVWMIGAPNHFPGVAMIVDETPPSERFVAHENLALCSPFAERREIIGRSVNAAKRCRRAV